MTRSSIAFALVVLAACGGSEPKAQQPAKSAQMSGNNGLAACASVFQRQRECTAEFIPALVAARVQADKPAGIAAKDTEIGRDALVAGAHEEWKEDSTDEAINAGCEKILAEVPPEQVDGLVAQTEQCMAADACQPFVDCIIPVISSQWH